MPLSYATLLLAEITVQQVGGWLAALFLGGGVLWVLLLLMVRGFWDKTGKPAVKELILAMSAEPETAKKRTEEFQAAIQTWHNAPEQLKTRTDFIKNVIDNEVRRDDGVIHKDITTKVTALEADLAKKIDGMSTKFDKFQETQERRDKENREFNSQVLAKLARIEGTVQTVTGRKFISASGDSYSTFPAQHPPKSRGSEDSSDD